MSKVKLSDHFYDVKKQKKNIIFNEIECDILINNKKRKSYGKNKNKLYLNNDDYIQIRIFNSTKNRIGAQIEFNGLVEKNMIIINPGQKIILDRFVDTKERIKFSTYFVNKKNKIKKLIKKNGNINIHFWKEKNPINFQSIYVYNNIPYDNNDSGKYDYKYRNYTINYNSNDNQSISYSANNDFFNNKLETGRLEKGEKSNQKLINVNFSPDYIFHIKKFKLLPFSQKNNINISSYNCRIYCLNSQCGYRIRNRNWKHCPKCGKLIG